MGSKVSSKMAAPTARVIQVRLTNRFHRSSVSFFAQAIRPHTPLIKFPNRQANPKPNALEALKTLAVNFPQQSSPSSPLAAVPPLQSRLPGPMTRLPGTPDSLASVQMLPQRYRRRTLAFEEMEYIQRGGPE